jgi:hypothetical protein
MFRVTTTSFIPASRRSSASESNAARQREYSSNFCLTSK